MATLKEELAELLTVPGIATAVVVSRDGFVIEGVNSGGSLDMEAVGAVVAAGIGATEVIGGELQVGGLALSMIEYETGVIMAIPVGANAALAIVADLKANLGNVRYQVKKRAPVIEKVI